MPRAAGVSLGICLIAFAIYAALADVLDDLHYLIGLVGVLILLAGLRGPSRDDPLRPTNSDASSYDGGGGGD